MNKFKRLTLGTLLGGLAAGIGWKAFAHGGRNGRGMHEPLDPERVDRLVKHLAVEIDATPQQQERLSAIAKDAARDLAPLRGQAMETRRQAIELLSSPNVDRAAIENLRAAKLQHADAVSRRLTQALGDAAEVLTPEQRSKLAERASRWHGRWHRG